LQKSIRHDFYFWNIYFKNKLVEIYFLQWYKLGVFRFVEAICVLRRQAALGPFVGNGYKIEA